MAFDKPRYSASKGRLRKGRSSSGAMGTESESHTLAEIGRFHDFKPAKAVKCEQIAIAAADDFRLAPKRTGYNRVVIRVAADLFAKDGWANHCQLAFENGQRTAVVHGRKLLMQPFRDLSVFRHDGSRRHEPNLLRDCSANYLQRRSAEEYRAHDNVRVKDSPHALALFALLSLRTLDIAFEMSSGVIPAAFACRRDSANASSNSAAISSSVGVFSGCMIIEPLYVRMENAVPLSQPYIWRNASGRTTCPFEDIFVVITFVMSILSYL